MSQIVCHIKQTNDESRWYYHDTEEDLRKELIEYWNEVHAEGELEDYDDEDEEGPLHEDAELEKVIERIETRENVSIEGDGTPEKVWVCKVAGEYAETITVHRSRRGALEAANEPGAFKWGGSIEALDLTGMTDDEAEKALDAWWEEHGSINDQFTITETEIQE